MKRRTPSDREDHDASAPIEAEGRYPYTTLEASEHAGRFYRRLTLECGTDVDLELLIRNERRPNRGPTIGFDPIQATTGDEP